MSLGTQGGEGTATAAPPAPASCALTLGLHGLKGSLPAFIHSVLLTPLLPRGTVTFYFTLLQLITAHILSPRSRALS